MKSSTVFLLFFLLFAIQIVFVTSVQFQVGESHGWEVPTDHDMYNIWASTRRFKVDDTLNFNYRKNADSVLEVTEAEYKKCHSDEPISSFINGDSVFKLDRSGSFYFISGIPTHCKRGQKLIVTVLGSAPGTESPSPAQSKNQTKSPAPTQEANQTAEAPANPKNNAVAMHGASAISFKTAVLSLLGVFFF